LIEIAPSGGAFYLDGSAPAGRVALECYYPAAVRTNACLIANTIDLASPRTYITDRDPNNDTVANAGGTIEFRGDLINQSQLTNEFRLDSSTLRAIGGGTNAIRRFECASRDVGARDPGTNNFALGRLVLGQRSSGATGAVKLLLCDQYDNNTADAAVEALYATNLALYANSILCLNGCPLYCKNSGAWQRVYAAPFPDGDGTGQVWDTPQPPTGALMTVW
jgi:hypothetical protein